MRLLIAEDEKDLAEALAEFFSKNNFLCDVVNDGESAYDYASASSYDAIILDVMMPKMDGIEVLKKLREDNINTPIMMLTAKGQKEDRILGFDSGADDYLPKPFDPDELLSRVRAMLRRSGEYKPSLLSFADIKLDENTCLLSCNDKEVSLSAREYQIMELFMRFPKMVFSAERIMEKVWGYESEAEINVIWVHISNLRKKLKEIQSHVTIKANRNIGYSLEEN